MSTVSLNLPESLYKQVCTLAQQDGVSLNQFITTAVAEKVAALREGRVPARTCDTGESGEV
jgi:hypothetical protein